MNPQELYQEVILRHSREPVGFERRSSADLVLEAYNPLCGDQFQLFLELKEGRIREAHFFGYGCAISKASTSVLVERLPGKTWAELRELLAGFHSLLHSGEQTASVVDQSLLAFAAARQFPARMSCATLSWDALKKAVDQQLGQTFPDANP